MIFLLVGCQDKPVEVNSVDEQAVVTNGVIDKNIAVTHLPCVSKKTIKKSPPIQDKSKIKAMLFKSGIITTEMTLEQANKVVDDFIRAKQSSHSNNCK